MEKVTRYRCKWCGKEFKTPDRHACKWDPDAFNCLSCVHRGKFVNGEPLNPYTGDYTPDRFECAKDECGWNEFESGLPPTSVNRDRHCPSYETIPGWKGKETFKAIARKREAEAQEGGAVCARS